MGEPAFPPCLVHCVLTWASYKSDRLGRCNITRRRYRSYSPPILTHLHIARNMHLFAVGILLHAFLAAFVVADVSFSNSSLVINNSGGNSSIGPNITCTGSTDNQTSGCLAINHCYLPSGTVGNVNGNRTCPSSNALTSSLGIFNAVAAALSLVLGHQVVRDRMSTCFASKQWGPWSGVISACLQMMAMMISTAVARSNGFGARFGPLLGLWTMRPRIGLATYLFAFVGRQDGKKQTYQWTLKDIILSESILNIFSIPFAMHFLRTQATDQYGCRVLDYSPPYISLLKSSFGFTVFAGFASLFILGWQIIRYLSHTDPKVDHGWDDDFNSVIETCTFYGFSGVITLGAFISNWVLWGGETLDLFLHPSTCLRIAFLSLYKYGRILLLSWKRAGYWSYVGSSIPDQLGFETVSQLTQPEQSGLDCSMGVYPVYGSDRMRVRGTGNLGIRWIGWSSLPVKEIITAFPSFICKGKV